MRAPLVVDTDPGLDDALALFYLAGLDHWDLRAITTVAGNVPVERAWVNATSIAAVMGLDDAVPVYQGCPKPLMRALRTAQWLHGEDGLGGVHLPGPVAPPRPEHAVNQIVELSHRFAGELEIIALGPLTNLAAALVLDPAVATRVKSLVFMGGAARSPGNVTPSAEFNVWVDPEAANIVVGSGIPYTMVGLDVTDKTLLGPGEAALIEPLTPATRFVRAVLDYYLTGYEGSGRAECALHDPFAVGVAARPGWVHAAPGRVTVETASALHSGKTDFFPDYGGTAEPGSGSGLVALDIAEVGFAQHFIRVLLHGGDGPVESARQ